MSNINRSAIRQFALRASAQLKNGKFTRVSEDFLNDVEAELERIVRGIAGLEMADRPLVTEETCPTLIVNNVLKKIGPKLNLALARHIQRKVMQMPTCGKTL